MICSRPGPGGYCRPLDEPARVAATGMAPPQTGLGTAKRAAKSFCDVAANVKVSASAR